MLLYHGSNCDIQKIDFEKCRSFKDFGQGFYLTTHLQQAKEMADKVAMRFGGATIINAFEIQDDFECLSGLLIKKFNGVDRDWAEFVM